MTPAAYIRKIISENINQIPNLTVDDIYTFYVDESNNNSGALILITENVSLADDYGNNDVLFNIKRVQIDFYYPRDYEDDMAALENSLKRVLRDNGVFCYSDAGHILSLDSMSITNTLKFNFKMEG